MMLIHLIIWCWNNVILFDYIQDQAGIQMESDPVVQPVGEWKRKVRFTGRHSWSHSVIEESWMKMKVKRRIMIMKAFIRSLSWFKPEKEWEEEEMIRDSFICFSLESNDDGRLLKTPSSSCLSNQHYQKWRSWWILNLREESPCKARLSWFKLLMTTHDMTWRMEIVQRQQAKFADARSSRRRSVASSHHLIGGACNSARGEERASANLACCLCSGSHY